MSKRTMPPKNPSAFDQTQNAENTNVVALCYPYTIIILLVKAIQSKPFLILNLVVSLHSVLVGRWRDIWVGAAAPFSCTIVGKRNCGSLWWWRLGLVACLWLWFAECIRGSSLQPRELRLWGNPTVAALRLSVDVVYDMSLAVVYAFIAWVWVGGYDVLCALLVWGCEKCDGVEVLTHACIRPGK